MGKQKNYYEISKQHLANKLKGVNSSNKAQLKRIEKLKNVEPKPPVPTSKFYMYINKEWVYKGLSCRYCNTMMTDPIVIDNHQYICKVLNTKDTED